MVRGLLRSRVAAALSSKGAPYGDGSENGMANAMRSGQRQAGASEWLVQPTLWFVLYAAVCVVLYWRPLHDLVRVALSSDTYSHILLIPFISMGLVWMAKGRIFAITSHSPRMAAAFLFPGALLWLLSHRLGGSLSANASLELAILSLLCFFWCGFALIYGKQAFRAALYPLLFLLLAVPPPEFVLDRFIWWLQLGSGEVTSWIFHLTGTPFLRQGLLFTVPGVTIEIAKECSGIRSTLALLITLLVAGYLLLRTAWARVTILAAALPVLVLKNGIRIATLTLLAIHVDPGFLFGRLHHQGGFIFFALGVFVLLPILLWLQKIERKQARAAARQEGTSYWNDHKQPVQSNLAP
jgi:exosortase